MLRGLVHVSAWALATGAAVTLSWWGVHSVMAGTAYGPPRALPIGGGARLSPSATPGASTGSGTSTGPGPSRSPSAPAASASSGTAKDPGAGQPPGGHSPSTTAKSPTPPGSSDDPAHSGAVRGYNVSGGRVVFDLGAGSAQLVSATPASGWRMERWIQTEWIRVTFTRGSDSVSVFCTWNGHPPAVEINDT
ncbi:hypothetical protein ACFYN0_01880 [Streptomyces sp. NPDC006704]|uniref:hypothetical protein n=1 Tax=Streptomyces sp. NPDC006704 TaxID=3364760 RepID=UPI0036BBD8D6